MSKKITNANVSSIAAVAELELQMFIKPQKMIEEIKDEDNNVCPPDAKPVLAAGWISIETEMPPLNEKVLVFDDFHRMNICKRMDEVGYKIWNTESIIIGITHWMQLPSKPACS